MKGLLALPRGVLASHGCNEHVDESAYAYAPASPENSRYSLTAKDMSPAKEPMMKLIPIPKDNFSYKPFNTRVFMLSRTIALANKTRTSSITICSVLFPHTKLSNATHGVVHATSKRATTRAQQLSKIILVNLYPLKRQVP